jgi:C_GCAxxG_C_C family probable redox protein
MAMAESQGIQSDLIPRIATGFCSGISRTGGMCGALSGAIMGINLATGRNLPGESRELNYSLVRRMIDQFEEQHGPSDCPQLLGCDLATEAGQKHFKENNLIERCGQYVDTATRMALSLIDQSNNSQTP